MHHVDSYVFDLLFMIIFFYSIYGYSLIFVFVPMHWIIKAIFTVPVIIWLIFCLMSIDSTNIIIFLFSLTGAFFPIILRLCQSQVKKSHGIKRKFAYTFSYVLLPLFCTFFWLAYIIAPIVIEYVESRPSSECRENGRLVELSKDTMLRIYPNSTYSPFWIRKLVDSTLVNTSEKKFCEHFSHAQAYQIDEISEIRINPRNLCIHPTSKAIMAYCSNIKNELLKLDSLDIEFVKKNKDEVSVNRLESFQKKLEDAKELSRKSKSWTYGEWLETKQFNNGIELHRFYPSQNTLIIPQVDWLPSQTDALKINCYRKSVLKCGYNYEYNQDWNVSVFYIFNIGDSVENENDDDNMPTYDQTFIDMNLEGAQKAYQMVEDFIEALSVK
ncbi:hypothetical protein [Gilliamella apis]|uniref:hypothetical protein n=1 Tax=Gilliamella apis TaxID=1970738 RepID=UPI000A33A4D3|nr:hypothetical protein [Gilliamella apis]OTQ56452.1 hypothetical protein B6D21_02895 [Gilliamella apis]